MTIGRVTISAADWLASRVTDRMALVTAGQKPNLVQQGGGASVPPTEEGTGAELERRQRERSNLAAQESYKRVAARIKSRLANPPDPRERINPASLRMAQDRDIALEALRDSPRIAATLIVAEQRADPQQPIAQAARPEPLFALVETGQKKHNRRAKKARTPQTRWPRRTALLGVTCTRLHAFPRLGTTTNRVCGTICLSKAPIWMPCAKTTDSYNGTGQPIAR